MAVPPANPPVLPFQQKGASFIPFFHSQPALILQPGFISLSTAFPVGAARPLLVTPSPERPSDNGDGIDGFLDHELVQQAADLRHGQGQQIGGQIDQVLSPR
jgi:hypothetical protein